MEQIAQRSYDKTEIFRRAKAEDMSEAVCVTFFDGVSEPMPVNLQNFGKTTITFGRNMENDIRLSSAYVSRFHHGQFRREGRRWLIEDLNSRNGLIFEGENIKSRILEDGDCIRIDDGLETTTKGLLMVVSESDTDTEWKTFDLTAQSEAVIGRDPGCDVILNHAGVSKRHAKIKARGGCFYLSDTGSANGTLVDGQEIEGEYLLGEKDVIMIVNSVLVFSNGRIMHKARVIIPDAPTGLEPVFAENIKTLEDARKLLTQNSYGKPAFREDIYDLIMTLDLYKQSSDVAAEVIKRLFPPPQLTYDRFMGELEASNSAFLKLICKGSDIIGVSARRSARRDEFLAKIKDDARALADLCDDFAAVLISKHGESGSGDELSTEINSLQEGLRELIDAVKNYSN